MLPSIIKRLVGLHMVASLCSANVLITSHRVNNPFCAALTQA
jgi:hypothetical protein